MYSLFAQELKAKSFNARKRFQLAIICVRAVIRIKRLHNTPEPLSTQIVCTDPYRIKVLRKVTAYTMWLDDVYGLYAYYLETFIFPRR